MNDHPHELANFKNSKINVAKNYITINKVDGLLVRQVNVINERRKTK